MTKEDFRNSVLKAQEKRTEKKKRKDRYQEIDHYIYTRHSQYLHSNNYYR